MTVAELYERAKLLSVDERRLLVKLLIDLDSPDKQHSILELEGLGAEIWEGIDPQEYIDQLRSEWDHRP